MAADGVDVAGLDTAHEKDVYIPAYNTPEFAKAFQVCIDYVLSCLDVVEGRKGGWLDLKKAHRAKHPENDR